MGWGASGKCPRRAQRAAGELSLVMRGHEAVREQRLQMTSRCKQPGSHSRALRRRSALVMTETEDRLIAALASIGLSSNPKKG